MHSTRTGRCSPLLPKSRRVRREASEHETPGENQPRFSGRSGRIKKGFVLPFRKNTVSRVRRETMIHDKPVGILYNESKDHPAFPGAGEAGRGNCGGIGLKLTWNMHSLFVKILAVFIALGLLPLLFVNQIWYHNTSWILYQNELESADNLLEQIAVRMENAFNGINVNTYSFLFGKNVQKILENVPATQEQLERNTQVLQSELSQIRENNTMISTALFLSDDYQLCSKETAQVDYDALRDYPWFQRFTNYGKQEMFTPVYVNDYIDQGGTLVIGWLRRLRTDSLQSPQNFLVEISYSSITAFLHPVMENSNNKIFLFDSYGNVLFHPDQGHIFSPTQEDAELYSSLEANEEPFSFTYEGRQYSVTQRTLSTTKWRLVMAIDTQTLLSSTDLSARQVYLLTICVLCGVVICAYFLSRRITRPIFQLSEAMKRVEANQLDVTLPTLRGRDEVSVLAGGFNNMLSHIRRLLADVRREESHKRAAEMKMLQAQINPHFLYNTLNVIRWRAVMHNEQTISKMIISLIRLLEFSGKKTDEFVTVEKELEHAKSYVELILCQYADKFSVEYDVSREALPCYTIKFILQPLIENSIFHGLIPMEEKGLLQVSIQPCAERLHFTVRDNGMGMEMPEGSFDKAFRGLGLANVNERLRLYYGEGAGLQIRSKPGCGTQIDFEIPKMDCPPEQEE